MITHIHQSLLKVIREGLEGSLPADRIYLGEGRETDAPSIGISNTGFSFLEQGVGGSSVVSMVRVEETFPLDGKVKEFTLKQEPLRAPMTVGSPKGALYTENNDFSIDYENKRIRFFSPPKNPENQLVVAYAIKKGASEIKLLSFQLSYLISVAERSLEKRDDLVLSLIKAVFMRRKYLLQNGVDEIVLMGGDSLNDASKEGVYVTFLEYQVQAKVKIEIPIPPVEKIEIRERR